MTGEPEEIGWEPDLCSTEVGTVNPVLPVVKELVSRGCEVRYYFNKERDPSERDPTWSCVPILWHHKHFEPFGVRVKTAKESWTEVLANHDSITAFGQCIVLWSCQKCVAIVWHHQHFKKCSRDILMN